jgi:hypothetical protein
MVERIVNQSNAKDTSSFPSKTLRMDRLYHDLEESLRDTNMKSEEKEIIKEKLKDFAIISDILNGYTYNLLKKARNSLDKS